MLDGLLRDLRYGSRSLRKNSAVTVIAVMAMVLGIGMTTTLFSVINGFFLKGLPFPDSHRLYTVNTGLQVKQYSRLSDEQEVFENLSGNTGNDSIVVKPFADTHWPGQNPIGKRLRLHTWGASSTYSVWADIPTASASVSIASNIVEGCARFSEAEYIHFLDTAYGSSREMEYQIGLSHRLGFVEASTQMTLQSLATETAKVLNGLLRSLRN